MDAHGRILRRSRWNVASVVFRAPLRGAGIEGGLPGVALVPPRSRLPPATFGHPSGVKKGRTPKRTEAGGIRWAIEGRHGGTKARRHEGRKEGRRGPRHNARMPLDPLDAILAAPEFHRLLLENEHIRMLETRIEPGQTVPLHTHRWPAACYFLGRGDIVRRDGQGRVEFDSRTAPPATGPAAWLPPLGPHTLENVGKTVVHVVSVEVKRE